jgi:lipoprotein-anchoring transpeptidase ErfK/SrfK
MIFRTTGAIAALLLGLGGASSQALAQYYPPPTAYPPPQAYPPAPPPGYTPYRPARPVADADDQVYDLYGRPVPPAAVAPQAVESQPLPAPQYGRAAPVYQEDVIPPPAGGGQGYQPGPPPQQGYPQQGYPQQGYEPAAAGTRPYYGGPGYGAPAAPPPAEQEATRPPLPIGPGQVDPRATVSTGDPRNMAAFPAEVRPETGPKKALPPQFRRALVDYYTKEPAGTLIVDTQNTYLYLVLGQGKAMRYGIGVGREGFTWSGSERVTRMAEWPDWHPPEEMIERQPYLPRFMAGGDGNPLGARALYLGKTVYRIHGTNQPSTIGTFVSSGCIRLTNEDVTDLYTRVKVGTRVVVLPGKAPPATASAAPVVPSAPAAASAAPIVQPPAGGGAPMMTSPLIPPPSAMAR